MEDDRSNAIFFLGAMSFEICGMSIKISDLQSA